MELEKWTLVLDADFTGGASGPLRTERLGERYMFWLDVPHVGRFRIGFSDYEAFTRFDGLLEPIREMAGAEAVRDALYSTPD